MSSSCKRCKALFCFYIKVFGSCKCKLFWKTIGINNIDIISMGVSSFFLRMSIRLILQLAIKFGKCLLQLSFINKNLFFLQRVSYFIRCWSRNEERHTISVC